jgi:hypothetical protein
MLLKLQTDVYVDCFYCGSDDVRVAGAATILADDKWICATINSEDGLPRDAYFPGGEKLLKGFCIPCQKTFSIDIQSSRGDIKGLREVEAMLYVQLQFSDTGVPEALLIESRRFPIIRIESHKPTHLASIQNGLAFLGINDPILQVHDDRFEPLFGRAPFGTWAFSFNSFDPGSPGSSFSADCVVDVSPLKSLGVTHGDILSISVKEADPNALKILSASKATHSTQALGRGFLTLATFSTLMEMERMLCKLIWDGLAASYGANDPDWWKKSLGSQVSNQLQDRMNRSHGQKPLSDDLHCYLTLGEGIALMDSKWDHAFAKSFKGKKRLLLQLNELERLRNVAAHGRPIDFKDYVKSVEIAVAVRDSISASS